MTGDRSFECQNPVETVRVLSTVYQIPSNAGIDGENRHYPLCPYRHSHGKLLAEGRTMKFYIVRESSLYPVFLDIGALVILSIRGNTCPEVFVEIVHGIEIYAYNTERTGYQKRFGV